MKKYEIWLAKYATFINDLEGILNEQDWKEELNDIAEDISLAYDYRKALEKAPKKLRPQINEWDQKLLKLGNKLRRLHKPAYEYFVNYFGWLLSSSEVKTVSAKFHYHSPAIEAETAAKS